MEHPATFLDTYTVSEFRNIPPASGASLCMYLQSKGTSEKWERSMHTWRSFDRGQIEDKRQKCSLGTNSCLIEFDFHHRFCENRWWKYFPRYETKNDKWRLLHPCLPYTYVAPFSGTASLDPIKIGKRKKGEEERRGERGMRRAQRSLDHRIASETK